MTGFIKRAICLVLCLSMLFCVVSCANNGSDNGVSPIIDGVKQEGDMPHDETESEEVTSEIYEEEPVSSNNYDDAEKEILDRQPTESSKNSSKNTTSQEESQTDKNAYTGRDYGNKPITKENLDFDGKVVTLMQDWQPYRSGNFADKIIRQKLTKIQKKYNVKLSLKQAKVSLAAEVLSGTAPKGHLYAVDSNADGGIYTLLQKGSIAELSSAMKATGIDMTANHYNSFNTGIFNVNDKQWTIGVGYPSVGAAVLYHKKLIDSLGYDIPALIESKDWTWDKMTEIALKATVRDDSGEVSRWGIGIGKAGIKGLVLSNGGHIFHPDNQGKFTFSLNTDNTKQALKRAYNWCNSERVATYFADGVWSAGNTEFAKGKVAMYFADEAAIKSATEKVEKEDLGIAYIPMGPDKDDYVSYITNGYCYVVPAHYQKITTELLLLMDELFIGVTPELHSSDVGVARKNSFATEKDYDIFKRLRFDNSLKKAWDGSDYIDWNGSSALGFESMVNGSVIPEVFVENNQEQYNLKTDEIAKTIKYTGSLN